MSTIPGRISAANDAVDADSVISFTTDDSQFYEEYDKSDNNDESDMSIVSNSSADSRWDDNEDNFLSDNSSPRLPQRRTSVVSTENIAKLLGDLPRIPRRRATLIFATPEGADGIPPPLIPISATTVVAGRSMDRAPRVPGGARSKHQPLAKPVTPPTLRLTQRRMRRTVPLKRPNRTSSVEVDFTHSKDSTNFNDICKEYPSRKCKCSHSVGEAKRKQQKSATAA